MRTASLLLLIALYAFWAWPDQHGSIQGYGDSHSYKQFPRWVSEPGSEGLVERNRAITYPIVIELVGRHDSLVHFQTWLSLVSWCTLGWVLARHAGVALFGLLSLATTIRMWNLSMLTESLSLSLLALGVAICLELFREIRWPWVVAWVVVVVSFAYLRDGNLILVPAFALPFLPSIPFGSAGSARDEPEVRDDEVARQRAVRSWAHFGIVAAFCVVVMLVGMRSANHNRRWAWPLQTAISVFVREDPEALQRFLDAGMPEGLLTRAPGWRKWLEEEGRGVYARWVVGRWESYRTIWDFIVVDDERDYVMVHYFIAAHREGRPKAAITPIADRLYVVSGPPPWLMLLVFGLPLADRLMGRKVRIVSLLPGLLLVVSFVQTFTGYWGAGTEFVRHTLIGSVAYRMSFLCACVAIVSLLPVFRRDARRANARPRIDELSLR